MAFTAVVAALGVGEPANWGEAIKRLARTAALGSAFAEEQLKVLSAASLLGPPQPVTEEVLSVAPRISSLPGFLPAPACEWLIKRAEGRVKRAEIFDAEKGGTTITSTRDNSVLAFFFRDFDLVMVALRQRIAATLGVPHDRLEPSQVMHYAPGQTFGPHHDFLDPSFPGFSAELAWRGQRANTFLVYLNSDFTGGETEFSLLGIKYRGRPGDALLFNNLGPTGEPETSTLHAGLPVITGEKWLFSQWIRDKTAI